MAYQLEGKILEVCDCKVLCPCWIGEDADNGICDSVVAYHVDRNHRRDDLSGLTIGLVAHIPGNVLQGNWKVAIFVDDTATPPAQRVARCMERQAGRSSRRSVETGRRSRVD